MFDSRATAELVLKGLHLENKKILVTGVSSGLGKETLRVFTQQKVQVLGTARTFDKAEKSCREFGPLPVPFECEMSNFTSIKNCIQKVRQTGLRLDAIIANA